jgi:adenylylsulfate kinase-like enzyme
VPAGIPGRCTGGRERGKYKNINGVSDPYEEPENAEIVVDNENQGVDESVAFIMEALGKRL